MTTRNIWLTLIALALTAPLMAMDSLNMPTGNSQAAGNAEMNFILVTQDRKVDLGGNVKMDDMRYSKLFVGVTEKLNIDLVNVDIKDAANHTIGNVYYTLAREKMERPSLLVGVTNITGENWLGGVEYNGNPDNDDPSPFAVGAKTIRKPAGKPSLSDPMIRVHLGYGTKFHGDQFFGQIQVKVHPKFVAVAQEYKSMPTYIGTVQLADNLQISGGTMDGNAFYRIGGAFQW